ncbi:MAG: 7-cyano-7-deazaguanine synthase [Rhizobiaceae bacterium]|nr:7-cyano-7-deazaguanine synthase [Rhizobiaceae bacterium]
MRVAAIPSGVAIPGGQDLIVDLFGQFDANGHAAVGAKIPYIVRGERLRPAARAWDFAALSMAVVAADEGCPRTGSADGWTRQIELTVAVADSNFWAGQAADMARMLAFLTGDMWTLSFISGGHQPAPDKNAAWRPEDVVCLLSGGLDSLIGALDLVKKGKRPLFVSQVAKGDKRQQRVFAQTISPGSLHLQMNHNARMPHTSERSQRARSMGFFGFGALAATSLKAYEAGGRVPLVIPENGYISINVPLTPLRRGSLSTRTTHPHFLAMLQQVFNAAGLRIDIANPYQLKTKGEMLKGCLDQPRLKNLASYSTSCGRYARSGFRQCGRCVPCLVRRAAFGEWGGGDATPYRFDDLGKAGPKYRDFDDVRSAAVAVRTLNSNGIKGWVGGALNSVALAERSNLGAVAERGLREIERFLSAEGAL